ncbi:F0F1 ATP synthase subunit A [Mycoplasma corogypsi]|uniref:F0F1 ATP synthase subunit A n=1 Tax=Mycoplasma corogypsi TaxID=2106 RepID=UPI00387361B3
MNGFSQALNNPWHPQLVSLIVSVLVIVVLSITVAIKVTKVKPDQAPKGIAQIAEAYVGFFDTQIENTVGNHFYRAKPYIITLSTFILVGNFMSVFGFEPIVTSYSVPFTLALASWLGIFVCGAIYEKWHYLLRYLNPLKILDTVGKITPLISLSIRIYGNVVGGSVVIFTLYYFAAGIKVGTLPNTPNISGMIFLATIITPFLHFYFDLFGSTLQAYVFTMLTMVYWLVEVESETKEKSDSKVKKIVNKIFYKNKLVQNQTQTVY